MGFLAHQPQIDSFLPKYYAANVVAKIVCEDGGNMRLKLPTTVWRSLNIPDKGDYTAYVKGEVFKGRYDVTAGFRLRIPSVYKNLFSYEANDGREVRIDLWVEDGTPRFTYKDYEESPSIPSGIHPQYSRGQSFCSVCHQTFENRDRCPYCNRVLRKKPRKKKSGQSKQL
ncbi:MAG: hypothetical protein QXZ71_05345 [Candidatus Caldarchaeum sp.]